MIIQIVKFRSHWESADENGEISGESVPFTDIIDALVDYFLVSLLLILFAVNSVNLLAISFFSFLLQKKRRNYQNGAIRLGSIT